MADRTLTVAGRFGQPVEITNSLQNGDGCHAQGYSHAEGFQTSAEGSYSYAGGHKAHAVHERSYVWSGRDDGLFPERKSQGAGTYSIYVGDGNDSDTARREALSDVYINETPLGELVESKFGASMSNASLRASQNTWTNTNEFTEKVTFNGRPESIEVNGTANFTNNANFAGVTTANTVQMGDETSEDKRVATVEYVGKKASAMLGDISSGYVKRENPTEPTGSNIRPVYVDENGVAKAIDHNVVTYGDSGSVGSDKRMVYLSGGSITPSNGNVGDGVTLIQMKDGTFTVSTSSVGTIDKQGQNVEGKSLVYLKNGKLTASDVSLGARNVPIYLEDGTLKSFGGSPDIGSPVIPVYLNGGSITACRYSLTPGGSGGGGINEIRLSSIMPTGMDIKGNIGADGHQFVKKLSGYYDASRGEYVIYGVTARPTIENIEGLDASLRTYYAPSLGVYTSGTGTVVTAVEMSGDRSKINVSKGITPLVSVNETGTVNDKTIVKSITKSGTTVSATRGYVPLDVTSVNDGGVLASISYSSGVITQYKKNAGTSGGLHATDCVSTSSKKSGKAQTLSYTTPRGGIIFIHLIPNWSQTHVISGVIAGHNWSFKLGNGDTPMFSCWSDGPTTITLSSDNSGAEFAIEVRVGYFS